MQALKQIINSIIKVLALPVWVVVWTAIGPIYGLRSWAWNVYHDKQPGEWMFVIPYTYKGGSNVQERTGTSDPQG